MGEGNEGRIVLDRKAFGALAVDSRVKILKALRERRKMLTELADELGLSASSTKEHLDTLADAGLVSRLDDGHKWKYYELTRKGNEIVTPGHEIRVWVLLGMSIMGLLLSSLVMFNSIPVAAQMKATDAANVPAAAGAFETANAVLTSAVQPSNLSAGAPPAVEPLPLVRAPEMLASTSPYVIIAAVCALVLVACILYLVLRRTEKGQT